jgi:hypothetical protein
MADQRGVVALVKDLHAFGPGVRCRDVDDNGATADDVRPYLTAVETGRAILRGLSDASIISPGEGRN